MSIRKFLVSRSFWLHLLGAVMLLAAIIYGTLAALDIYTHHGEKIEVPDFKGLNRSMVRRLCDQNKIQYEVMDSVFAPAYNPGTVIDQTPHAGFNVKEGRTIFITISAQNPEQIKLPELTDLSLRQAKAELIKVGLLPGEITYRPSEYVDLVLAQKIDGEIAVTGTLVYKGSSIDLVIGQGLSRETTDVPNLFGMTLNDAYDQVWETTLSIGAVVYDPMIETAEDSLNARVWKQNPGVKRKKVKKGTSIDIWISIDETKFVRTSDEAGIQEEDLFRNNE